MTEVRRELLVGSPIFFITRLVILGVDDNDGRGSRRLGDDSTIAVAAAAATVERVVGRGVVG